MKIKNFLNYIIKLKFIIWKETFNLEKINELWNGLNLLLDKNIKEKKDITIELERIQNDFRKIKTKEHKEKIDLFNLIINHILWRKK
jgi:hypothetical protein